MRNEYDTMSFTEHTSSDGSSTFCAVGVGPLFISKTTGSLESTQRDRRSVLTHLAVTILTWCLSLIQWA
jgi:hypothetical protein